MKKRLEELLKIKGEMDKEVKEQKKTKLLNLIKSISSLYNKDVYSKGIVILENENELYELKKEEQTKDKFRLTIEKSNNSKYGNYTMLLNIEDSKVYLEFLDEFQKEITNEFKLSWDRWHYLVESLTKTKIRMEKQNQIYENIKKLKKK